MFSDLGASVWVGALHSLFLGDVRACLALRRHKGMTVFNRREISNVEFTMCSELLRTKISKSFFSLAPFSRNIQSHTNSGSATESVETQTLQNAKHLYDDVA